MASWDDLVAHMRSAYGLDFEDESGRVGLTFSLDDGRSQRVLVSLAESAEMGRWAQVGGVIGEFSEIDLASAVRLTENHITGAIGCSGDLVTVIDSFPLDSLDTNDLDMTLRAIAIASDALKKRLTGKDVW